MLIDYLRETYGENEPILVADIQYDGMTRNTMRQQIMKLTDSGQLRRYDTGVYFIPRESIFKSGTQLSRDKVIERKYLLDNGALCGYVSGVMFANRLGLTTQVPTTYEIVTNKASSDYRETRLAAADVILRRPRVRITEENARELQLLDLLKDIDTYAEIDIAEQKTRIRNYMRENEISFDDLRPYLSLYPDRLYRNMYEVGLIHGDAA